MKFADLIKNNSWLSIEITLLNLYPDEKRSISGYEEIFNKLKFMRPVSKNISIIVKTVYDSYDNIEYIDVSGSYNNPKDNTHGHTNSLAIEFTPWNEWLGMEIDEKSLQNFSELEVIAHCLYEMTFIGFEEEEIQAEMKKVEKDVEEYKNMTDEEKEKNTTSLDELLKEFGEEEKKDNTDKK